MPYLIAGYISIWLIWMPLRFYTRRRKRKNLSTVFKIIPTLMAAGLAGWACVAHSDTDPAAWLFFAGVLIGAGADATLEYRFTLGGTLFFIAHCLFIVALMLLCQPNVWFIVVFCTAFAFAVWFLSHYRARFAEKSMRTGVMLYAVALSALLGAALPAPWMVGSARVIIGAVGAALFVLSDATLCRNTVAHRMARAREAVDGGIVPAAERRRIAEEYLSLGCYYTAQVGFALCAYVSFAA